MRWWSLTLLTLFGIAAGGLLGFLGGFFGTAFLAFRTDVEIACVLLQKAETARFITGDQRQRLVDAVVPALTIDVKHQQDAVGKRVEEWMLGWAESWRAHMKSGCPDA
jgi:hypothetical protein